MDFQGISDCDERTQYTTTILGKIVENRVLTWRKNELT